MAGFGPKPEEMIPSTFPDLPIHPTSLNFHQKTARHKQINKKKRNFYRFRVKILLKGPFDAFYNILLHFITFY